MQDLAAIKNDFQERPEGTSWTPLDKIVQNISIPDEIKQSLYKSMTVCFHPILNDKNVLALMFLLLTFAQDESENDSEVVRMVSQYWTMLRRHLTNTSCEEIEKTIAYLGSCLVSLPGLLQNNSDSFQEII